MALELPIIVVGAMTFLQGGAQPLVLHFQVVPFQFGPVSGFDIKGNQVGHDSQDPGMLLQRRGIVCGRSADSVPTTSPVQRDGDAQEAVLAGFGSSLDGAVESALYPIDDAGCCKTAVHCRSCATSAGSPVCITDPMTPSP